jgi:ATP-dependent DNA helicase RecG
MSTFPSKTASELLTTPVQFLKGVGPERGELLSRMGLRCARDVLFFFPRDYEDMSELRPIGRLEEGRPVSVCGWVEEVELKTTSGGKVILGVLIREQNDFLRAIWFNQAFLRPKFRWGAKVLFSGTPKMNGFRWEMVHPNVAFLADNEDPPPGRILPVYGLTEGVNQQQMRRVVHGAVEQYASLLDEVLPESLRDAKRIWPIQAALPQLHSPRDKASLEQARHRFVYQELLVLQLGLAMRRAKRERDCRAPVLDCTERIDARIRRLFPFSFTVDQNGAIADVVADLRRGVPMNRLLQGDVGSGKTVVAMYAMLVAVSQGYQAALMAPTEVLARQHARTLERSLKESRVRIGLLTGSISAAGRREMLQAISGGQIDLVVGTHAVIHAIARSDARFAKLGLVVIDEQHKFGVRERAALREAGIEPHYLVMTATPIPRTVSMTLFGDLDLSTLRSSPPGRQPVHTYLAGEDQRPRWWEFFRKKLREGRQGIVIVPMVEEREVDIRQELENWNNASESPASLNDDATDLPTASATLSAGGADQERDPEANSESVEHSDADGIEDEGTGRPAVASVARAYESLVNGPLAEFRVDLIHGRLSAEEKDLAMEKFRDGATQVLVATSVIEVGVDVPNVAVMTIENGERFGLAQLHQLRGRVGRGQHAGYVCVFASPNAELSQRRLEAFTRTTDGFELAELDFELRGPGDLFGTRQHGLPPLRIADLRRDIGILRDARKDAQAIIAADPELRAAEYARLRRMMLVRYGESLDLGDVG